MDSAPTTFDSFNARALPAEAVARTFIPSNRFEELVTRTHSLIVGPRGSGKTSLLKMLQTRALEAWHHPEADRYRKLIDYTGIFIPTDISWRDQLESLGFGFLSQEERQSLCGAAFSFHVIHAVLNGFLCRMDDHLNPGEIKFRRVTLSVEDETYLVKEISRAAHLSPTVNSVRSLKHAALSQIAEISRIAMEEVYMDPTSRAQRFSGIPFLAVDFIKVVALAIEIFNDLVKEPSARWALLFDELELAPKFIISQLLRSFRSVDERLLFKISISPYTAEIDELRQTLKATPGQDFTEIKLWYSHKEEGYSFGEKLLQALAESEGFTSSSLEEIFGESPFERDLGAEAYQPGSQQLKTIASALENDPSVRRYFKTHNLTLDRISAMGGQERAKTVRKIYPTLLLREFFRVPEPQRINLRQEQRSRKNPSIYGGATGLLAMTEGNPRWLIGVAKSLFRSFSTKRSRISLEQQTEEIMKTVHRFRAVLKVIPVSGASTMLEVRTVLSILDKIGEFFYANCVLRDFVPQPYGSFIVDANVSGEVLEALGIALNAGAIVFVPDKDSGLTMGNLKGKRFRLCYLLSPFYKIPIRLGDGVALSRILSGEVVDAAAPAQQTFL